MVSKKWQKRNFTIEHLVLFGIWAGTIFWFEIPHLPGWLETLIVVSSGIFVFLLGRHFLRKSEGSYVKVVRTGIEDAMQITQRMFRTNKIPFRKMPNENGYEFEVFGKGLIVNLEEFPLNIPLDLNFVTEDSTKITLTSEKTEANSLIKIYCDTLDQAFAA